MSIFKKTIKALGFSGEDNETETHPYTAENITNACLRDKESTDEAPVTPFPETAGGEANEELQLPHALLEVLAELLNRSLPDYALAALDKEAEKKYLFEHLGDSFKQFVTEVNERSRSLMARQWETKHQALTQEVEDMRAKMKELEEQRNVMQNAQLSAERQKRAVSEKVHELETRIATLEAEKEQFELENKSLVNNLKVSTVHQGELDSAMTEISRLQGELKKHDDNAALIESLHEELRQARAELSQAQEKESEWATKCDTAGQELSRQEEKIAQQLKQIQALEAELSEAQNGLKVVEEVEAKLQQFEQIKAAKDEKIAQLSKSLQAVEDENKRLHSRLEELTQQQERQEKGAQVDRQEVETLKSDLEKANTMIAALRNQRQELLSQIDELKSAASAPGSPSLDEPSVDASVEDKKAESTVIDFNTEQESGGSGISSNTQEKAVESVGEQLQSVEEESNSAVNEGRKQQVVEETADDNFPDFDTFSDNWLIPTRPDTPEMIAKRKEEEKKKREAEEQAALAQKKTQQVDSSQMSLW